jgi:hypothetical protein
MSDLKDPRLKFKYAAGAGDVLACILHSKFLGKITKWITGKDKPCGACNKRAQALNILFPIPFWRLFFKNNTLMMETMTKDLEAFGYIVNTDIKNGSMTMAKIEEKPSPEFISHQTSNLPEELPGYILISSSENQVETLLIKTNIYKSKK